MVYFEYQDAEYISAVSSSSASYGGNITADRYNAILNLIHTKPTAEIGYDYRLKVDLTWELYELPEPEDDEATIEDYEQALSEVGI